MYPKTKTPLIEITTGQKRPPNLKNGINLDFIDHLAIAVEENQSEKVCEWYQTHFKFKRLDDIKIQTAYNGLLLKILQPENVNMYIVFASSLSKPNEFDQIKDFLQNHGPGLQHIAFHCDILNSIERAKKAEVSFISPPSNYYDRPHAKRLLSGMKNGSKVKSTGLLVDHDELDSSKILLQAFTKPVSNGGLFFELIQRINNSQGFGQKNVKALFDGVEEERSKKVSAKTSLEIHH